MYWKITAANLRHECTEGGSDGRFVLHRHRDAWGEHLDLRIEWDSALLGWRIDDLELREGAWATEKAPHPVQWLEQDGEAVRVDAGVYEWLARDNTEVRVALRGRTGEWVLCLERKTGLAPAAVRDVSVTLAGADAGPEDAAALIRDGLTARSRAIARLCGLGRELDGDAFDEKAWRKALTGLTLDEIHGHLRAYEQRFDAKYPPEPVSRPEKLPDIKSADRSARVMKILGED